VFVVLRRLVSRFLFHPVGHARDWLPPPPGLHVEDLDLASADGTRLHAWWATPSGWQPEHGALLYCHGNAGNLSHRGEGIRRWLDLFGMGVLIFDYPGYGKSGGRPTEAGCYAAADAAYDWLLAAGVPGDKVLLYGGSLGGAVAIDLASRRPHRALVLVAVFSSLEDMARKLFPWLPTRWLVRDQWDNLAKIRLCTHGVFIAHGTADRVVPYEQGERLYAAAPEPRQFFPMSGYDHNHTPGPEFYQALRSFMDTECIKHPR
jgi:fermentation-respiration switch protein FrsA (DUF1100 family)